MNRKWLVFGLAWFVVISMATTVYGQTVSGTVRDAATNNPLPGVNILVVGTSTGTATDAKGHYSLNVVSLQDTLRFSFIGYKQQMVPIGGRTTIDVALTPTVIASGNQLVVVGYGIVKKSDLAGAISSIDEDQLNTVGTNTVTKALQGKLAGVEVESAGGNPGAGVRILIRGVGTWNNDNPLYIVDGVQVPNINNLNPNDIANISVLKDASAAAIYGSRAANGVVLVTTKSGTGGKASIQMNASFGVQELPHKKDVLNSEEYARVDNAAQDAAGLPHLDLFKNPGSLGIGTNWQNKIYRVAPVQSYDLSISGGGRTGTYRVSFGYFNQDGIVKKTSYRRLNLQVKSQTTVGRLKLGESVLLSGEKHHIIPGGWGGEGGNPVAAAALMLPIFNVYNSNAIGGYAGAHGPVVNIGNPVAQLNLEHHKTRTTNLEIDAFAKVDLFKGLFYKLNFGYTNSLVDNYHYTNRYKVGTFFSNPTNNLIRGNSRSPFVLLENTLHYKNTFGKHDIRVLVGYTMQKNKFRTFSTIAHGLPDGIFQLGAATGSTSNSGSAQENTLLSELGRIIYTYNNRYTLTATLRRDGSSRFGQENRYGIFPSIAVAWDVTNEKFFSSLTSKVASLKLRASYGKLGNQEFADYTNVPTIALNRNYVLGRGQNLQSGAAQIKLAANNLKWESTSTFDIGLDAGLFNNSLDFTADYYNKKTTGILLQVPIPGSVGVTNNPEANAGSIRNHGIELSLSYSGGHQFRYNIRGTFTANRNRVLSLASGRPIHGGRPIFQVGTTTTTTKVGSPVGSFYLIHTNGIFNSEQEIQSYRSKDGNLIQPNAKPGDIRFVDTNGDGVISDADDIYSGSPFPKFSYGLGFNGSWKGLTFSIFFQGTYGNKIYNGFKMTLASTNLRYNWSKAVLNAWTPEHHTNFPRVVKSDPNNNNRVSNRFIEDGSYLRIKSIHIGYTFNSDVLETVNIASLQVYLSLHNVFTFTKYSGFNPDIGRTGSILNRGVDYGLVAYPLSRRSSIGIKLNL